MFTSDALLAPNLAIGTTHIDAHTHRHIDAAAAAADTQSARESKSRSRKKGERSWRSWRLELERA